jgi:hypothetical protein
MDAKVHTPFFIVLILVWLLEYLFFSWEFKIYAFHFILLSFIDAVNVYEF